MFRVQDTSVRKLAALSSRIPQISSSKGVTEIYQKDFDNGPLLITEPGKYILMEDIIFDPLSKNFSDIFDFLGSFPEFNHQYILGYFAAIIIYGSNIDLNLGGHTIRQSHLHNHQQRFFSLIELADRPFLPGQGPGNFGSPLKGCSNVHIYNGILGLSSHHGIHGNNPTHVNINNLVIYDYEVAGISINGGKYINVSNVEVRHNYKNVLVNALFSNAIFTIKKLTIKETQEPNAYVQTHFGNIGIAQIIERMKKSVLDAYTDIVNGVEVGTTNPDSKFYANPSKLTDGNCYGISFNAPGLLVNEYKDQFEPGSTNINLTNITITDIDCNPTEVLTVTSTSYNQLGRNPQTFPVVNKGPFGDVINYWKCSKDGVFNVDENPLVLGQILTGTVSNPMAVWIQSGVNDFKERIATLSILNNLDIMAHVMKGTIGLFISSIENVICRSIKIYNIHNQGMPGCEEYMGSNHQYIGARTCGILIASSKTVQFEDVFINDIVSSCGEAYGYYLYGKCNKLIFPPNYGNVGSLKTTANYLTMSKSTKSLVKSVGYDTTYGIDG